MVERKHMGFSPNDSFDKFRAKYERTVLQCVRGADREEICSMVWSKLVMRGRPCTDSYVRKALKWVALDRNRVNQRLAEVPLDDSTGVMRFPDPRSPDEDRIVAKLGNKEFLQKVFPLALLSESQRRVLKVLWNGDDDRDTGMTLRKTPHNVQQVRLVLRRVFEVFASRSGLPQQVRLFQLPAALGLTVFETKIFTSLQEGLFEDEIASQLNEPTAKVRHVANDIRHRLQNRVEAGVEATE